MKKVRRILAVCHELPPVGGGGGIGFLSILKAMPGGVTTDIITAMGRGLRPVEKQGPVTIYRVGLARNINLETQSSKLSAYTSLAVFSVCAFFKALSLCFRDRYDALYSNYLVPSGVIGTAVSALFRLRHVATIVEGDIMDASRSATVPHRGLIIPAAIKLAAGGAHRLLAISGYSREMAIRHYGIARPIEVVNFGIERPPSVRAPERAAGLFTLSFLGRLVERKGLRFLFSAMKELPPEVRLVVIGEGPLAGELGTAAKEPGLEGRVLFAGRLDEKEKRAALESSDAFVFPSVREGLGLVAMEAMAAGLPVISTRNGGTTDFMDEGTNALYVDYGSVEQLKEAILKLKNDTGLRSAMGAANLARSTAFFCDAVALRYLEAAESD
ncbi:MAG: glycosyltransferase family 4 protein [Elusimicrobia bacterium]|nr:glycosyltransferase family 4 protein [Elusimicrobiota bacterium]